MKVRVTKLGNIVHQDARGAVARHDAGGVIGVQHRAPALAPVFAPLDGEAALVAAGYDRSFEQLEEPVSYDLADVLAGR